MPGWPQNEFPNLNPQNHSPTSPVDFRYNCIAWAAGDQTRKWWPDAFGIGYWPPGIAREETVAAFIAAFQTLGFSICSDNSFEVGFEKIVISELLTYPCGNLSAF